LVNNYGNTLETYAFTYFRALIKRSRREENVSTNGKIVMFCNPNGVYIQFFALENSYVREYLRQVTYTIILGLSDYSLEL
jgi:hypothetical protein